MSRRREMWLELDRIGDAGTLTLEVNGIGVTRTSVELSGGSPYDSLRCEAETLAVALDCDLYDGRRFGGKLIRRAIKPFESDKYGKRPKVEDVPSLAQREMVAVREARESEDDAA